MARKTWKSDAASGNLGTTGNWSTASLPSSSDIALFREGEVSATSGSLTTGGCFFSADYTGDFGNASFDVAVACFRASVIIDKPDGAMYATFGTPSNTAGKVIIRRLPPSGNHSLTLNATDVIIYSDNRLGRGPFDYMNIGGSVSNLYIVNKTTGNTYINLDTITISKGLYVSGPAVVESTDSTITGKFVTVHPGSSLTFGEGDTLQDDSYIVGSKVQFNAQNLSASNNVELTGATVTVTNTQSGALAIGAFNLNRESRLVLDCPIVPTAGTITSYGGRVDSDHPLTFTLSAYGKLSTTAFRALDFENAQNSGHFQTGIMA